MTEAGGRRHAPLGLSVGNWITLAIFAIGMVVSWGAWAITYGGQLNQSSTNTQEIKNNKDDLKLMRKEIKENTKELRKEIKDGNAATQKVMKDQIQLMIKVIENGK